MESIRHDPATPEGNAAARRTLYLTGFNRAISDPDSEDAPELDDRDYLDGWNAGYHAKTAAEETAALRYQVAHPEPPPDDAAKILSDAGGVRVYHGDALRILRGLPPHSVDAFICDPPYSSGGMFKGDRMASTGKKYVQTGQALQYRDFNGDNRDQRAYLTWSTLWLSEALRVCKPAGLMLVFTDWRQIGVTIDALQCGGFIYRGIIVWDKTEAARPRKGAPRNQCEYVVWGSNGAMRDEGECFRGVHRFSVAGSEKTHIAGKPDKLMRELVKLCPPGGILADCFCGSGTTLKAAKALGREAWGMELNAEWAADAVERAASEMTLFLNTIEEPKEEQTQLL